VRPTSDAEAGAAAKAMYADRKVLRARAAEALAQLRAQAGTAPLDAARDPSRNVKVQSEC
jgi:hypothetical protein